MMKTFQEPDIQIIVLSVPDIIATSVMNAREDELGIMDLDSYN